MTESANTPPPERKLTKIKMPYESPPTKSIAQIDASTSEVYAKGTILEEEDGTRILHIEGIEKFQDRKNVGREARQKLLAEAVGKHGVTRIQSEVTSAAMAHTYKDLFGDEKVFTTIDGTKLSAEEASRLINEGVIRIVYLNAKISQNL